MYPPPGTPVPVGFADKYGNKLKKKISEVFNMNKGKHANGDQDPEKFSYMQGCARSLTGSENGVTSYGDASSMADSHRQSITDTLTAVDGSSPALASKFPPTEQKTAVQDSYLKEEDSAPYIPFATKPKFPSVPRSEPGAHSQLSNELSRSDVSTLSAETPIAEAST